MTIQINTSNASPFLPQDWLDSRLDALAKARTMLEQGNGPGGSFTGWVHLPRDYDRTEFDRIQAAAAKIRADSQALVVIGIGGSYLGARAVVELLHSPNYNLIRSTGGPWSKNTARKRRGAVSMPPPTPAGGPSRAWRTRRATRNSWCPTRWAAAIPSSPPWDCCPSPARALTLPR